MLSLHPPHSIFPSVVMSSAIKNENNTNLYFFFNFESEKHFTRKMVEGFVKGATLFQQIKWQNNILFSMLYNIQNMLEYKDLFVCNPDYIYKQL